MARHTRIETLKYEGNVLSGLRDKYFNEPYTIEDAVHNVVTYLEAQQYPKYDSGQFSDRLSKSVR